MFWNSNPKQGGGGALDATKLKATLRLACSRFDVAKNKKEALMKHNMREIATLLAAEPHPKEEKARIRVERLIKDDQRIEAYEILQLECQLLLERVQLLKMHSSGCPPDLVTCVSDLIYAAPRAGDDIPELLEIKNLLAGKFGKQFAMDADTNKDGTLISPRIVEKLSLDPPTGYLVHNYMMKIAKLYEVPYEPTIQLTLEEAFEPIAAPIGYSVPVATGTGLGKDVYQHQFKNPEPITPSTAATATGSSSSLKMPPTNPDFHSSGSSTNTEAGSPAVTVMKAIAYVPEEEMLQEEGYPGKHSTTTTTAVTEHSTQPETTVPAASLPLAPKQSEEEEKEEEEDFTVLSKEKNTVDDDTRNALTGLSRKAAATTDTVVSSNSVLEQSEPIDEDIEEEEEKAPEIATATAAAAMAEESKLESLRNRLQVLAVGTKKDDGEDKGAVVAPATTSSSTALLPVDTGIMTAPLNHDGETTKHKAAATADTTTAAAIEPLRSIDDGEVIVVEQDDLHDEKKKSCLINDCSERRDNNDQDMISCCDHAAIMDCTTVEDVQKVGEEQPPVLPVDIIYGGCEERNDNENLQVPVNDTTPPQRSEHLKPSSPCPTTATTPTATTQKDKSSGTNEPEHITGAALAGGAVGFVVAGSLGGLLGAAGAAHLASKATKPEGSNNKAATMARKCGKKVSKMTNKLVQKMDGKH